MKKIVVMGECMVELTPAPTAGLYQQSFAGDVYNSGVYIKRCLRQHAQVSFLSVIGQDEISDRFIQVLAQHQLQSDLTYRTHAANMGLYMVNIDEQGERSFSYWRQQSAATHLLDLMAQNGGIQACGDDIDVFYFSGISLAILPSQQLPQLWLYIEQLKCRGCQIVFDVNYRATLWSSPSVAKQAIERAYSLANMVLPGVDDHRALYGVENAQQVADFLQPFAIDEIVIKNSANDITIIHQGQRQQVAINPVARVVDSTSAGDAFNGAYLSARLMAKSPYQAAVFAAEVSACVIGHRGAIVAEDKFAQQLQQPLAQLS